MWQGSYILKQFSSTRSVVANYGVITDSLSDDSETEMVATYQETGRRNHLFYLNKEGYQHDQLNRELFGGAVRGCA